MKVLLNIQKAKLIVINITRSNNKHYTNIFRKTRFTGQGIDCKSYWPEIDLLKICSDSDSIIIELKLSKFAS